jgi:DNA repair protein RecN (Recombination protein N)
MIRQLNLENISFFKSASIEFYEGFNVITGETGAGKTLLVGTLLALTGEKADIEVLDKSKNGSITGIFELSESVLEELRAIEIEIDNPVIIRRSIKKDGKSLSYINDMPISSQTLKKIGALLFDLHGQHEHQLLMKKEYHIKIIDILALNEEKLSSFKEMLLEYNRLKAKYNEITRRIEEAEKEREMLEYTGRELSAANLSDIDEEELLNRLKEMENSEDIKTGLGEILRIFNSEENVSLNSLLTQIKKIITDVSKKTNRALPLVKEIDSVISQTSEFESESENMMQSIIYDEEQLSLARSRYDEIERLKKKYRMDLNELIEFHEKTLEQLKIIENPAQSLSYVKASMDEALQNLQQIGEKLHEARMKASLKLEKSVNKTLTQLNMPDSEINVRIDYSNEHLYENGFDSVEIFLKNRFAPEGMPFKKIASGGEISRVMLAVKNSLNESDPVGTLIFDEIDQGISGDTAAMVALSMQSISKSKQVISITHLPQIAAKAQRHIIVKKEKQSISAQSIEKDERIKEIARLLGSSLSLDTAIKHAKALLKE